MKNIVIFNGGLGNQLFQYAFLIYLQERLGRNVGYNLSMYRYFSIHTGFQASEVFDMSYLQEDTNNIVPLYRIEKKLKNIKCLEKRKLFFCNEKHFDVNHEYKYFFDYWQKAKYCESIRNELMEQYRLSPSICCNDEIVSRITNDPSSVYIHLRRGDYVNNPQYVDLAKSDYYKKALEYIKKRIESPSFYIFSDDQNFARKYFDFLDAPIFIDYPGQTALGDLYLMNLCRNAIIANSSFSWWGAFIRKKNYVLHPSQYHNGIINNGLYPSNWIEI